MDSDARLLLRTGEYESRKDIGERGLLILKQRRIMPQENRYKAVVALQSVLSVLPDLKN